MRMMRFLCWLALPAGLLLGGLNMAAAQGSDAVRQACTPDALRLCSQFIPNVAKITNCMLHKRSQLSEACRVAMAGGHPKRRPVVYRHQVRHYVHVRRYHHYRHYRHYHHYYHHYRRRR